MDDYKKLEMLAKQLIEQIEMSDYLDQQEHNLKRNIAFKQLKGFLMGENVDLSIHQLKINIKRKDLNV
jgi:hypothetical protein